jgi:hypothetical protein
VSVFGGKSPCILYPLSALYFVRHFRLREEKYRHLSLDIGEVDQGSHHFSIQQGLQRFFSTEKIEVKCEKCQEGSLATQSMKIISWYATVRPPYDFSVYLIQ